MRKVPPRRTRDKRQVVIRVHEKQELLQRKLPPKRLLIMGQRERMAEEKFLGAVDCRTWHQHSFACSPEGTCGSAFVGRLVTYLDRPAPPPPSRPRPPRPASHPRPLS